MEDVDSEFGSQNRLKGVDIDDPAHVKDGTMVTMKRPGTSGEAHSTGCSYHKQNASIMVTVESVFFLVIQMCFFIADVYVSENAIISTH